MKKKNKTKQKRTIVPIERNTASKKNLPIKNMTSLWYNSSKYHN